jgi:hypothetical protein
MSTKSRIILSLSITSLLFANAAHAQVVNIQDGSFSNWIFGSWGSGGGTGSMAVTNTAGNPPPALINTTTTPGGAYGSGYGVDNAYVTSSPIEGLTYKLSLLFESGPGAFGLGQGLGLVVEQNGVYWLSRKTFGSGLSQTWKKLADHGLLSANSFTRLSASGPKKPDFTSGVPTQFGFGSFVGSSGTFSMYYDDFALTIQ